MSQQNDTTQKQDAPPTPEPAPASHLEVESLRAQLKTAEQARDEYLALARQGRADFENYQKRAQRDLAVERRFAQEPLARDLIAAIDNLERAIAAAEQAGDKGPLVQGVSLVLNQLLDVLRRHGVTRLEAQGQPFDHDRHEAVMQQPSAEHPPDTVLQVLAHGYMMHERVLRPAKVIVSSPAA